MITEYTLFTTLAFHHLVIGSILILLLLILVRLFKLTTEMRSWIWMTAFILSTLAPFSLFVPTVTQLDTSTTVVPEISQSLAPSQETKTLPLSKIETNSWHFPTEIVFELSSLIALFCLVWIIGSIWRSKNVIAAFLRTHQLIKSRRAIEQQHPISHISQYPIFISDSISSPMVVSLISPKILIPGQMFKQFNPAQLTPIILHEQAHIKRGDIWFGFFQELIAIVFWWSPIIRVLNRKIHLERELACDLRAAKELRSEKQYAQSLIDCAKLMVTEHRSLLAMGLFSQKKDLNKRIELVINSKKLVTPSLTAIFSVCLGLTITTVQAAQHFSPKISVSQTEKDAKHFSLLPKRDGLRLIAAVLANDIQAIQNMQQQGVDIDTPAIGDGTALIIAVKKNNEAMVRGLIELGADVNQSSRGDGNPLITAAMTNNLELAQVLITQGADVNGIVPYDETPLINATRRGYLEMSQFLIEQGADVNLSVKTGASDGFAIRSPLNMARSKEVRELLYANGAIDQE
jgi:beta-lactamase regulating signal transducer with metallopeptidase domain